MSFQKIKTIREKRDGNSLSMCSEDAPVRKHERLELGFYGGVGVHWKNIGERRLDGISATSYNRGDDLR